MRQVVLIIVLIMAGACSGHDVRPYSPPDFPERGFLQSHRLTGSLQMQYPLSILAVQDYIYVLGSVGDTFVRIYDRVSGEFVRSAVRRGRGPGELLMPGNMYYDNETGTICIYDIRQMRLQKYAAGPDMEYTGSLDFGWTGNSIRNAWQITENISVVNGQTGMDAGKQGRLQLLSADNRIVGSWNMFPIGDKIQRRTYFNTVFTMSPDRTKLAEGTLFGAILETFDLREAGIAGHGCRMFYPPSIETRGGVVLDTPETVFGFPSLCSTDEYVYGVFINGKNPDDFNNISVFDWEGNEVATYETDCNVLRICCSSEDKGCLYAVAVTPDKDFCLVSFNLPDVASLGRCTQVDPILEANVEALSRAESGGGILCLKNPIPGDKWYHNCSTCRPDSYSVSTMAFCYR